MRKSRFKLIFVIVVLLLSVYFIFKLSYNLVRIHEARKKLVEREIRYEKLLKEKEKIKKELEVSKKDINKEKFVRDKLNMKKEGETVYKVVDQEIVEENEKSQETKDVNKEESIGNKE
ncbi:MAG: septum formation initiator family protein [Streptobacillus sp.]